MDRIKNQAQFQEQIDQDKYTIMKFDATWCPDCKNLDRFIGDIISENNDKSFFAVDSEQFEMLAQKYDVRGIPSLLVFKNGVKIDHLHSKFAKTPNQIREYLSKLNVPSADQ
ncbi:thioredoxin family protein [Paenibacillus glycanilyticus]|uniref:thioredoxin family protein n=1 Tax=Paenibacillus glycanilyticus TaxID=126569 RepID=UPI00203D6F15|nr:thioredoxin family protein [Paenibacillus glycanilyticus]MCM3629095.1 thioredoxin family protein [Paenibacillus glycanilyticus]